MSDNIHSEWPMRPWVMAVFLGVAGIAFHFSIDDLSAVSPYDQTRLALAAFVLVGSLSFAFTLELLRWSWAVVFSIVAALVMSGVAYWNGSGGGPYRFEPSWSLWSGLVAVMIAAPLLQNVRDEGRWNLVYEKLHNYSWTDVVIFFTSLLFVGITFGLMYLLASLLNLIELKFLRNLLDQEWFGWMLSGLAFGASLGILRENDRLLITLQNLVLNILSVLAPVLAIGLVLFLISLPFTGLASLWGSTRSTTPILLSCAFGAVILSNAIIRNRADEISTSKILKISAAFLAVTILPLSVLSAYSMWLRIDQYGLTPDRIWGFVVVIVAALYGLMYLFSVLLKRTNWAEFIRPVNIKLAGCLCLLAVILALPTFNFGELSANSQLARLEAGKISADKFDYAAMAFDFGPSGRESLKNLTNSDQEKIASSAKVALAQENRWNAKIKIDESKSRAQVAQLVVIPDQVDLPIELSEYLHKQGACQGEYCALMWETGGDHATLISQNCNVSHVANNNDCQIGFKYLKNNSDGWVQDYQRSDYLGYSAEALTRRAFEDMAAKKGNFSIREVKRRQVHAGETPIGEVFE